MAEKLWKYALDMILEKVGFRFGSVLHSGTRFPLTRVVRWRQYGGSMTVAELKKKLDGIEPKTRIVISRETDMSLEFFEVGEVSIGVGTPSRDDDGKPGFKFEKDGPARWLFIAAEEG